MCGAAGRCRLRRGCEPDERLTPDHASPRIRAAALDDLNQRCVVQVFHDRALQSFTAFARVIAGRSAVMASGGIKTCVDAEGAIKLGADLVAVGRAVVVDPEWLSKVRSKSEASILAGLPKDEREIAGALSIPPRMVEYLLSRPGWIPRL